MKQGDVVLVPLPQANGLHKPRPAVLLKQLPPFGDWLLCGVSTQLQKQTIGFDDIIKVSDPDFPSSGLKSTSLIRLGFLAVLPGNFILGRIGAISQSRHLQLIRTLAHYLMEGGEVKGSGAGPL